MKKLLFLTFAGTLIAAGSAFGNCSACVKADNVVASDSAACSAQNKEACAASKAVAKEGAENCTQSCDKADQPAQETASAPAPDSGSKTKESKPA